MMNFSLFFLIWGAAAGALNATRHEIAAHVDYAASYQIGFNTLASFAQNAPEPARTKFKNFFRQDVSVFTGADATVLSKPVELKDIEPAFKRIYEAAKCGYVREAFAFLFKLKKVPLYLSFSCFTDENWKKFAQCADVSSETTDEPASQSPVIVNYKDICRILADTSVMGDMKIRQEILDFLCAHYHCYQGRNAETAYIFLQERAQLTSCVKKYLKDQMQFQKILSSNTFNQIWAPMIYGPLSIFLGIMALVFQENSSVKWGCSISAGVFTIMGLCATFVFNFAKFLSDQHVQWESVTNEFYLQRTADLVATFFVVMGIERNGVEMFAGHKLVEKAIHDHCGFLARTRQILPAWCPGYLKTDPVSIEKRVIDYERKYRGGLLC